ncbi:uncharacterized protein ACN2A1_008627 isoform 2-T2 [Glossina fuscipes fuscipes]
MVCILHGCYDAHRKMRFSLSPPPPKAIFSSNVATITYQNGSYSNFLSSFDKEDNNKNNMSSQNIEEEQQQEDCVNDAQQTNDEAVSDYIQWLHAMKLVARLPGGIPPEFRRKLWLSLAEKYMKSKSIDWAKEEEKCFCEKWREDDEELGVQIVKDLHRTGSTLCTGPAGDTNQAKLKRILLGYARYNPEVGYCQGFNMLGALILQVMDKKESESIKVMVYLVEGILPPGYFCGSMGGLQADMAVFRELMQTKLPRLAKHLQKLQGPIENAYEPPLTNVFTMQWFLTMFCTCLPMTCVLRVWDLVLIEGSDILLRTALVLWSLLEERVLSTRSADDFYGKMGSFSSELLNGHLIDSNGLIEKVVQLGPIADIQKLRDKHLYNITPLIHKPGIHLYYDEEEPDTDEDSRLAVATVWGLPWGRRGSQGQSGGAVTVPKQVLESKERLALDISLLKKQYDRLRERQKQAHIILTTACSTARQSTTSSTATAPVNQLLLGRPAIVTNKGRRAGPPTGAIPPARKPSLPAVLQTKQQPRSSEKELKRGETVHWHNTDDNKRRRDSLTWKEIKAERAAMLSSGSVDGLHSRKIRGRHLGKSDSSSYSEESDNDAGSSTDTSLCDEKDQSTNKNRTNTSSKESAENINSKNARKTKNSSSKLQEHYSVNDEESTDRKRPKSWAPSSSEIPFVLMGSDSPIQSGDEKNDDTVNKILYEDLFKKEDSATECDCFRLKSDTEPVWPDIKYSPIAGDLASPNLKPLHSHTSNLDCISKTPNTEQLSHTHTQNISRSLAVSKIGTSSTFVDSTESLGSGDGNEIRKFDVSDEGVTNQYFERVNNVERPNKLDLPYSLNEEEYVDSYKETETKTSANIQGPINLLDLSAEQPKTLEESPHKLEFLDDYSEKSPEARIKEATMELMVQIQETLSTSQIDNGAMPILPEKIKEVRECNSNDKSKRHSVSSISAKRRDPRRMTLTRSSTINAEESYKLFPKRLSMQLSYDFKPVTSYNVSQTSLSTEASNLISEGEEKRGIPSTEVLEERFHRMERELQLVKTDQNQLSSLPTQRQPEKREIFRNENKNTSSSLLEKQYTLSDSISKKDIDLRKNNADETGEEDVNNSRGKKCDKNDLLKHNKDAESIPETESKSEITEKQGSNTRAKLSRIPSTAELEDRFNALERDKSKQKYHPSKTKKEPPDDLDDKKTNNKQNNPIKNGKAVPADDGKNEGISETKEELKNRDNMMKKKSPPSTKELEKRFEALERRLSVATSEAEANENFKKSNSPVKSEKKISSGLSQKEQCTNSSSHVNKTRNGESNSAEKHVHSEKIQNEKETKQIAEDVKSKPSKRRSSHGGSEKKEAEKQQTAKDDSSESKENFNEVHECAEEINDKSVTEDNLQLHQGSETLAKGDIEHVGNGAENNNSANKIKSGKSEQSPDKKLATESKNNEATTNENAPENSQKIVKTNAINKREYEENDKSKIREAFHEKCNQISDELSQNLKTDEPKQIISSEENIQKSDSYQRRQSEPPSTAELEKRYEALKRRMSSRPIDEKSILKSKIKKNETLTSSNTKSLSSENKAPNENLQVNIHEQQLDEESKVNALSESPLAVVHSPSRDEEEEINSLIEENVVPNAPPMPPGVYLDKNRIVNKEDRTQQRALIEELQEKIKVQANGENIKPSAINPNRKSPAQRSPYHDDETSEAHATSAFYRSENYEPWSPVNQRMVRRFSDLPSRADLENRLQFLEQQLSNKLRKKRRASDSEVASKSKRPEEGPATSKGQRSAGDLEMRVQALEKQLSENSLKLLETMNAKMKEAITSSDDARTPTKLSTETIDVTGKELVKYTHIGEVAQTESHKPINISINIKMTLNKNEKESSPEQEAQQQHHQDVHEIPSTEELERRLQILEQQIKDSKAKNSIPTEIKDELQANEKQNFEVLEKKETEDIPRKESEPNEIAAENNETKANDKNAFNESDNIVEQTVLEPERAVDELEEIKIANEDCSIDENHGKSQQTSEEAKAETFSPSQMRIEKTTSELTELPPNVIDATNIEEMDPNKKTLVLLLDNQPKAMKVRRLTRANTEELEGLFQALEKQLSERNLIKSEDGKLKHADDATVQISLVRKTAETEAISQLSKAIAKEFTKEEKLAPKEIPKEEPFDWGRDPSKHHLKRKTVYLPSTKELEARFRSLERQIKLLEDVEKIDVEQRLNEIERKIKLQYSLSHEKDINKFLDLCEGKGVNEDDHEDTSNSDTKSLQRRSPYTSPARKSTADKKSQTPTRPINTDDRIPSTDDLEFRFRSLELGKEKSRANMKSKNKEAYKKQAIHPLEMLLDPSPDESNIPTTGELEHRLRLLEERKNSPSPPSRKSRSRSPKPCNIERQLSNSPTERELPSTEELEARLEALEQEHTFDFKMQKNFKEFNQKLKDAVSPSLSFEEFKASKSREESPKHVQSIKESKASNIDDETRISPYRSTSPKVIRFKEEEESRLTSRSKFERTTLADTTAGNSLPPTASSSEGLNAKGTRLIKETSPLRRSGTHTGVPLRTGENINDRLNSIKNTIKCIDTLCEEKPYRKEKCQRYIDSLFSDSTYFSGKKASLEDLACSTRNSSRSASKDRGPSIRIIEHSEAFTRSTGSIESVRSSSPLGLSYSPQYRSNRDLRRDISPRRRREEEREEYESRVRRDNILPIYFSDVHSTLSHKSHSLTKFHKVDRHLNTNNTDVDPDERLRSRSASISPLRSPYRSKEMAAMMAHNTTTTSQSTNTSVYTKNCTSNNKFFGMDNMTTSPYRYSPHNLTTYESLYTRNSNTPIYSPAKLEIRHTTVTSTFYDRVLTEKQIEKTLSRPSSRSPIVSPSVPYKNYADIMSSDVKSSPLHTNVKKDGLLLLTTDYTPINNYQFDKPLTVAKISSPSRIRTLNKKDNDLIDQISVKSPKTVLDSDLRTITATAATYLSSDKNISQHSAFDRVSFTNNNKLPAPCPTTTNAIINVLTTLQHPPRQNDIFGLPSIAQVQASSSSKCVLQSMNS